jgi:hypothetical protein
VNDSAVAFVIQSFSRNVSNMKGGGGGAGEHLQRRRREKTAQAVKNYSPYNYIKQGKGAILVSDFEKTV